LGAANDGQAKGASLGSFSDALDTALFNSATNLAEFFGIGEDDIHMLVESKHCSGHLPAILQGDFHAIVDKI
jgi:hypothetical protein